MKVEMGESLMYSWLCHVKGCQIVQTNWKASSTWPRQNDGELANIFASAKERFSASLADDLFKVRTVEQLIKQAEIDVLGISFAGTQAILYAVDIAFHEGGADIWPFERHRFQSSNEIYPHGALPVSLFWSYAR